MITIQKIGRFGKILDCPKKLSAALHNRLSYKKEGWVHIDNKYWRTVYLYSHRTNKFLWGLINRVEIIVKEYCRQYNETYEIIGDTRIDCSNMIFKFDERARFYQKEAAIALIENHGGIISIPTRCGKTFTAIQYLNVYNDWRNVLVVVTTKDLVKQWEKETLNLDYDMMDSQGKCIKVYTYQYLMHHKELMKGNDIVIWDEVHHVSAKVLYDLSKKCDDAIMIGLTATPFRNYEPEFIKIVAAIGEIVYTKTIQEMTDLGYLVKAKVYIKSLDTKETRMPWEDYIDVSNRFLINNSTRNNFIIEKALELASKNEQVLILVEKIPHGELLLEKLKDFESKIFVHGKSKDREGKLKEIVIGKYKIIISTRIYGEGVDIPNLSTLILACGGKSAVAIVQKSGRILTLFKGKKEATIIDFKDTIDYLDEHFEKRLWIYKKQGFEVIEI